MRRLTYIVVVSGLLSALAALPGPNTLIGSFTSTFMASRVLGFLPSGLLIAAVPAYAAATNIKPTARLLICSGVVFVFMVLSIPTLIQEAKTCNYMWRTTDYDTHEYADLLVMEDLRIDGRVVLSDKFTSYFSRRFLHTYAVTVPSQHASPAIDYSAREAVWQLALP